MASMYDSVPTWSGDASSFEAFVLACRWYEKSLKDTERKQCASRVWQKLTGPAKSVVKHLNPDEYEGPDGLAKLIQVLRTSPLQQLPIPDTYSRLEAWHSLRRNNKETIPELIVREDDLYTQLQQSLQRARLDRLGYGGHSGLGGGSFSGASPEPPSMVDPPTTPSRSPIARAATAQRVAATRIPTTVSESTAPVSSSPLMGDFEEEMRGYRLLKASRLTTAERQHVLTQTQNDTHYHRIRLALRTLFADENEPQRGQDKRIWWVEGTEDVDWSWEDDPPWEDWNYYGTWDGEVDEPNLLWNDPYGEWYDESWNTDYPEWEDEDVMVLDTTEVPEEMQYKEATVLAAEAQKTLREAREAVRKTRAARGYYAPESASGKGISGSKSSPSSSPKGKGYGGQSKGKGYGFASKGGNKAGPCFICGKFDHGYAQCPDRFSYKGNQKGKSKKGKGGKPKGKGKSKSFFVDIHLDVLAAQWDDSALYGRSHTRAIIDTGATENAIGVNCLHDLVVSGKYSYEVCQEDLPTFRFGNGHSDKARSRVDLHGTSLGTISFYVLDGMAASTPPLIGSRTLRAKNTMLSYSNGMFIFHDDDGWRKHGGIYAIRMQALQSGHLTIDLSEKPKGWRGDIHGSVADQEVDFLEPHETSFTESSCGCNHVFMVETEAIDNISSSIRSLAQRLQHLREQRQVRNEPTSSCRRRSSSPGIPMSREAHLIQPAPESAFVVDHMSSMRDEIDLPCQEGNGWSISPDGTTSPSHQVGVGATSKRDGSRDGDREDCEWQAHGVEGPGTSERIGQQHEHQHDVCGVLRTHGSRESLCQEEANILGEQDRASGHQQGEGPVNGCSGSTDAKGQGTVDQGCEEGDGPDTGGNCPDGVGADLRRRGSPGEEWQGQGLLKEPMMQLWSSLERLRSKMTAQPHVDTTRDGLEVVTASRSQQQPECSSTTKSHVISKHGDYDGGTSLVHETSNLEERHRDFLNERNPANTISPTTARKISTSMAALGVMLMAPVAGLFSQISGCPDFAEVACSPNSSLCNEMERLGYSIKRYNFKSGYDLERPLGTKLLNQDLRAHPPRSLWISLACTRLSALQNLTERDAEEWARFEKRQMQDLRRAEDVADGVLTVVENGGTFCWEWPTTATKGWNAKCIKKILKGLRRLNQPAYWCKLDGCAYGLEYQGYPVKKSWTILTNNKNVWLSLQKRCPGHQDHLHCRGTVAQASSYYPWKMVQAATKAIVASWKSVEDNVGTSLSKDVEAYLLDIHEAREEEPFVEQLRWEDPSILALTRNRFPEKPPVGRQLENIRQQMMRIHRASGHASFSNLQRLLRARKAPQWSIDMAGRLTCPECVESRKPKPQPPSSMHPMPGLFEIVGTDIFEFEHGDRKHKLILWRDRASGLVMVDELQVYGGPDDEVKHWEPKTKDVLRSFSRWLMHNPCPAWVISDPATYFTSEEFLEFMGRSGIGVLTIPAESHWMLGGEEGAISVLKMAVKRLLKEEADLNIDQAFQLAAHGHNQTIGSTGYSPFQWTRGSSCPQGQLPAGIDPSKAFQGALKLKEKARVAFEAENAKYKLSKLNNAKTRPASTFQPGTLLMLWRQRVRPGKVGGQWTGPVRALIQEGNTVWVATGATIIKARTTQLRACTQREQMQAMLEGTAVYKTPVTLETLLQSFTGKHFLNVTGENPSLQQMQDDVQGAEVSLPAQSSQRSDTWKMTVEDGKKWLVRVHNLPRLALFDPQKLSTCPMSLDELTGRRMTIIKPLYQGAVETTRLEDDFLTSDDPGSALQERWIGETRLEVKPSGDWDMNEEELYVWAPSELAVLYGANPSRPIMPLKVIKAFYGLSHAPRKWYEQVVKTLEQQGWTRLTADKCLFTLMQSNQLIGICGIHVDDFLLAGNEKNEVYQEARKKLEASFRWGRWDEGSFTFAGCQLNQGADMSIRISQEDYSENFLSEIDVPQHRKDNPKSPATPSEISKLRGVIGTVAWRASQTAPHYQADAGLMLSEIPHATVSTLLRANKLVREMRRESSQSLLFPAWSMDWRQITTIVWADASQKNRWDSSSTMGIVAGLAPSTILSGEEVQVAIVQWRSSKTPRQCLGSNGAEVQAITEGEDTCFRVRALWAEIHGIVPDRYSLYEQIKEYTTGGLVMDSRGIYDSITRNTSALHGLRSSRAGYELTLSIAQALKIGTMMRWVNGTEQLADSLTKASSRRVMHQFLAGSQYWKLVFDEKFTAGRKIKKRDLLEKLRSAEVNFVSLVRKLAVENRWPTDHLSLRSMGDESCHHSPEVFPPWFDET